MILRVSMKLINSSLSFRLDVYIPYLPDKLDFVTAFHQNLRIVIPSHYYDDDDIKMFLVEKVDVILPFSVFYEPPISDNNQGEEFQK